MEAWGVWKPGLTEPPTHGVVPAVTGTAPPLVAGGSIAVKGHNPAAIGLNLLMEASVTGEVSPVRAERCPGPVTGGPVGRPWPTGHRRPARSDQQALEGGARDVGGHPLVSLSGGTAETSRAVKPSQESVKCGKIAIIVKVGLLVRISGRNQSPVAAEPADGETRWPHPRKPGWREKASKWPQFKFSAGKLSRK